MDDALLRRIIAEIDEFSRDGEARSHIWMGKPANLVFITANRDGLISLARALLMAALSPTSGVGGSRPVTIEDTHLQILNSKEDVAIGYIENAEVVPIPEETVAERKRQARKNNRFALLGCALVGFILSSLIVSGLSLWIGIVTGK